MTGNSKSSTIEIDVKDAHKPSQLEPKSPGGDSKRGASSPKKDGDVSITLRAALCDVRCFRLSSGACVAASAVKGQDERAGTDSATPRCGALLRLPTHRHNKREAKGSIWGWGSQVRDGDQKLVEYILQRRVDVNQRGQVRRCTLGSPTTVAAVGSSVRRAVLRTASRPFSGGSSRSVVLRLSQFGDTALHWAVMGGTAAHDKIVKKLVQEGADANIVGAKAFTVPRNPNPNPAETVDAHALTRGAG